MKTEIVPKRENETLVLKLDADEVDHLRCMIFWLEEDQKAGHHNFVGDLMDLVKELSKSIRKFQQ